MWISWGGKTESVVALWWWLLTLLSWLSLLLWLSLLMWSSLLLWSSWICDIDQTQCEEIFDVKNKIWREWLWWTGVPKTMMMWCCWRCKGWSCWYKMLGWFWWWCQWLRSFGQIFWVITRLHDVEQPDWQMSDDFSPFGHHAMYNIYLEGGAVVIMIMIM